MSDIQDLEKLFNLKEKGIISQEEFDSAKAKMLQAKQETNTYAVQAYKDYWKKSFVWAGRATQGEYWWPCLFNILIGFVFGFIIGIISVVTRNESIANLSYVFSIITFFPSLSVLVRRFHDLGKSALFALTPSWILLGIAAFAFIDVTLHYVNGMPATPSMTKIVIYVGGAISLIVCGIIWLVFLCLPGQTVTNKYGDPK